MPWSKRSMIARRHLRIGWYIIATGVCRADSIGRRNSVYISVIQKFVECFSRRLPSQCFSRSRVQRLGDRVKLIGSVLTEIGTFRKVLPEQTIRVLIGSALPRRLWIAEVDLQPGVDLQCGMLRHFSAL